MDELRELGTALQRWADRGVGVVRVLDRHGFGTVEPGQLAAGGPGGELAGRLLHSAVDDVVAPLARSAVTSARTEETHVAEDAAVAAGLACAGGARLLGHPLSAETAAALGRSLAAGDPVALASTVDGAGHLVATWTPEEHTYGSVGGDADEATLETVRRLVRRGATTTERVEVAGVEVLVDLWVPVPTVLVVGKGAIGDALVAQAGMLGWRARQVTELAEAKAAVADFGNADVLVLLDHGAEFDAVVVDGVRHGRGFLGLLGSRHTQAARRERLLAAGLTETDLAALHAPVGLDLGAHTAAETAVSICAEVIAHRAGRAARPLAATEGAIGT